AAVLGRVLHQGLAHRQQHGGSMSTADRKAFAERFRPAVKGQSDKYSWRLYRRILKEGREGVYLRATQSLDGFIKPDPSVLKSGFVPAFRLVLGRRDDDWFNGKSLNDICTPSRPAHDWAFGPGWHVRD